MGRVLLLWRIDFDLDDFLIFIDIVDLAESLIAVGIHLNSDTALRDARERDAAILVGARFELGVDILREARPRVFGVGVPLKNDFGPVDGPASEAFDNDGDFGVAGGPQGDCGESQEKERGYRERAEESTPISHSSIISPAVVEWGQVQLTKA
jgi:hypothetical protein